MNLKNKVVLLTGASAGIGKELAMQLAQKGARLALCGRTPSKMQEVVRQLEMPQSYLLSKSFDATDETQCKLFVQDAITHFGCIDMLLNNAGANTQKNRIAEMETLDLDYMYALNMKSPLVFMREVGRQFQKQQSGMLVNILSSACKFANPTMGAYTATKVGLEALTNIYRKEMKPHGIKTLSVYPGGTDTDFRENQRPDYMSPASAAQTIVAALELPDDVAMHELTFRPMVEDNF